jgi:hypothetical protein
MIKIKKENSTKITGKGILKKISEKGIEIEDVKTEIVETITFDMLNELVGKNVSVAFTNKDEEDEE